MRPMQTKEGHKCESCKFWDDYHDDENAKPRTGACCRFPPVRNLLTDDNDVSSHCLFSYPVTGGHWWCGEFSAQERHELFDTERQRAALAELVAAGRAVVDRWDSPMWKDQPHTGEFIARLRAAVEKVDVDDAKGNPV